MANIEVEEAEETQQVNIPEDTDPKSWSASQTRMLIAHISRKIQSYGTKG